MTTIRKIESFDDTKENRETYVERVEQFFKANDFDDDHKVPSLLSLIGGKTYTLLRDLLSREKPATKFFQQIQSTPDNSNPRYLEPNSISPGFPSYFHCNFTLGNLNPR